VTAYYRAALRPLRGSIRRLALAVALGCVASLAAPAAAHASIDTSYCYSSVGTQCIGPVIPYQTVQNQYCTPFSNGYEYQTAADAAGVAQMWTFSNGSHPCIEVDWYEGGYRGVECYFYLYVPDNGYANAKVYIGWWNHDEQIKRFATTVDENTTAGWIKLNMNGGYADGGAKDVSYLQFKDNNGQTGTYIGWGAGSSHGMKEVCV
jgi:hypothetical protein